MVIVIVTMDCLYDEFINSFAKDIIDVYEPHFLKTIFLFVVFAYLRYLSMTIVASFKNYQFVWLLLMVMDARPFSA